MMIMATVALLLSGDNNTGCCEPARGSKRSIACQANRFKPTEHNIKVGLSMSTIENLRAQWEFNRPRTLALLEKIEQEKEPERILGWRPGPGRAHIAWQLMHIGITEELFATERLIVGAKPAFADLVPRFKGGSTPDDEIPTAALIRRVLKESRSHFLDSIARFSDRDLATPPEALPEPIRQRIPNLLSVLQIIAWHEPHHQGQAHITLNLWKASQS
jgi:uncharacterized damage-inducible protein DinB